MRAGESGLIYGKVGYQWVNFDKRVTLHMMNVFNSRATFGQAYIARDGSVNIDMAATVQGGVSRQYVKEVIDWWKVTVTQFEQNLFSG